MFKCDLEQEYPELLYLQDIYQSKDLQPESNPSKMEHLTEPLIK